MLTTMPNYPSNTELKKAAQKVVEQISKQSCRQAFVNRTTNYISVKLSDIKLTKEQLLEAGKALKQLFPDRFLKISNSTALYYCFRLDLGGVEFREPKVLVRFSQF